jgi:hypothetical protein
MEKSFSANDLNLEAICIYFIENSAALFFICELFPWDPQEPFFQQKN